MIPRIISRQHLLQAIQQASRQGVPCGRHSRDYCLAHKSGHYPPKYIIALAHRIARGHLLRSDEFNGGKESNGFLKSRGFTVVGCTCGGTGQNTRATAQRAATSGSRTVARSLRRHSERCPQCKVRIGQMLDRIYGTCLRNHRFSWPAQLSDYRVTPIFSTLKTVLDSLEAHRGHRNFVKAGQLDPCDFFVPRPGLIVEVDESQHFTVPRRLALSHYPPTARSASQLSAGLACVTSTAPRTTTLLTGMSSGHGMTRCATWCLPYMGFTLRCGSMPVKSVGVPSIRAQRAT